MVVLHSPHTTVRLIKWQIFNFYCQDTSKNYFNLPQPDGFKIYTMDVGQFYQVYPWQNNQKQKSRDSYCCYQLCLALISLLDLTIN